MIVFEAARTYYAAIFHLLEGIGVAGLILGTVATLTAVLVLDRKSSKSSTD